MEPVRTSAARMQHVLATAPVKPSSKPPGVKRQQRSDYTFAYVAGIALLCLVVGFVAAWAYLKPMQRQGAEGVAFAQIGPFHVETAGYTYNAKLAIQVDDDVRGGQRATRMRSTTCCTARLLLSIRKP